LFTLGREQSMHRPSAPEFLLKVLEALEGLPPGFAKRLAEVSKATTEDRSQAIRKLVEDATRD
jgi:hypothetical protein